MSCVSAVSAATAQRQKANVAPLGFDATFATRKDSKKFGGLSTKNRKNGISSRASFVVVSLLVVYPGKRIALVRACTWVKENGWWLSVLDKDAASTLLLKKVRLKMAVDTAAANAPTTQRGRAKILRARNCFGLSTQEAKGFGWARASTVHGSVSLITGLAQTDAASLALRQQEEALFAPHLERSAGF